MKKLLLIAALMFASFGAFAEEDIFDVFVTEMKKNEAFTVRADKPHRIIFIDIKLPEEAIVLSDEQMSELRSEMLRNLRDVSEAVKAIGGTIIYNFITANGKIYSLVCAPSDL